MKKEYYIDPQTFGGTKACAKLANLMNNRDRHKNRSLLSLFSETDTMANIICSVPGEAKPRICLILILREHSLKRLSGMKNDDPIQSIARNVIVTKFRSRIRHLQEERLNEKREIQKKKMKDWGDK